MFYVCKRGYLFCLFGGVFVILFFILRFGMCVLGYIISSDVNKCFKFFSILLFVLDKYDIF